MKKKLIVWMLVGTMLLTGAQTAFSEELSDGSSTEMLYTDDDPDEGTELLIPEDSQDTAALLIPGETSTVLETPEGLEPVDTELPETASDSGSVEIDLLTSAAETEPDTELITEDAPPFVEATINPDIAGNSDGTSIRQAEFTTAADGNILIGISGQFVRSESLIQEALDLINSYRLQACQNGEPDPRDNSRQLTVDDYVPITWSAALEWIAQTRAAESIYTGAHSRVDGSSCWIRYNGIQSWSEVLAWNISSNPMITGIKQWYGERDTWVNGGSGVTGHYTSMINPNYITVGLGCFYRGSSCVAGEFGYKIDSDTTPAASGLYTQIVQIQESKLALAIDNLPTFVEVGTTNSDLGVNLTSSDRTYFKFTPLESVTWSTDNSGIASVNSSGHVTAQSEGTTMLRLNWRDKTASETLTTVKRPTLFSAKKVSNGVQLTFGQSQACDGYKIYRKDTSGWKSIAALPVTSDQLTKSGSNLIYVDKTAKSGVIYSYSVSAYLGSQETSYDTVGKEGSYIEDTSISCQNADDGIQLNWTANSLLQGYRVYRKSGSSAYTQIASVSAISSYTDSTASEGTAYTYKVHGYNRLSESGSNEAVLTRLIKQNITGVNETGGIRLTWNSKSFSPEYRIYRATGTYGWTTEPDESGVYRSVYKILYPDYQQIATVTRQNTWLD